MATAGASIDREPIDGWREPSFGSVFRESLVTGQIGMRPGVWDVIPITVFVVVFGLILPLESILDDVGWVYWALFIPVIAIVVPAGEQIRAGRGWSSIVAAVAGCIVGMAGLFALWAAVSIFVAPALRASGFYEWLDGVLPDLPISTDLVMLFFVIILVVLIAYLVRRWTSGSWGKPTASEARHQDAIRAERAARLSATGREAVPLLPSSLRSR